MLLFSRLILSSFLRKNLVLELSAKPAKLDDKPDGKPEQLTSREETFPLNSQNQFLVDPCLPLRANEIHSFAMRDRPARYAFVELSVIPLIRLS